MLDLSALGVPGSVGGNMDNGLSEGRTADSDVVGGDGLMYPPSAAGPLEISLGGVAAVEVVSPLELSVARAVLLVRCSNS